MSEPLPAIAGGAPIRDVPLPYGRHSIEDADVSAVVRALRGDALTGGSSVVAFERALAERCGVTDAVAVASGTAALHLALRAVGVGPGDEVVTTPLTFAATANAVLFCGGRPVFADIGDDRCLDPSSARTHITEATRAVITVDYAGLPADVPQLLPAIPRAARVVVDAAHSLGGRIGSAPAGSLGDVSTVSFHPVKQITTGEGGACLTNDAALAAHIRRLRNHGMTSTAEERSGEEWRYDVTDLGYNYRLTDLQAALGLSQLARLDSVVTRRTELAQRYDALLADIHGLSLPPRPIGRHSAWHLYAVEVDGLRFGMSRDDLILALRREGIGATVHYPAVHLLDLYRRRGHARGEAPRAERTCDGLVTLPLFPSMTDSDQDDVVRALERLRSWTAVAQVSR